MKEIEPNDLCICGSGKKWKKCHDPNSSIAEPILLKLPTDERIDETLLSLGLQILEFFEQVLVAIKIDRTDRDRRLTQVCLAFYASKLHRVTLAGLTLIYHSKASRR